MRLIDARVVKSSDETPDLNLQFRHAGEYACNFYFGCFLWGEIVFVFLIK